MQQAAVALDPNALVAEIASRTAIDATELAPNRLTLGGTSVKPRYTHEAMADMILTNPRITENELAAYWGYTQGWVSSIVRSDAFQSILARRREELINPELRLTIEERFKALSHQSLRVLQEKLARPANEVPDNLALRAAELGAKALGIGGHAPPPPPPNPADYLPALQERLLRMRRQPADIVDIPPSLPHE